MAARTAKSWPPAATGAPDDEGSDGRPDGMDAADVMDIMDGGRLPASATGTVLISADDAAPTILVVDDDQTVTETFAMALHRDGFTVRTARSAETGLREAEAHHADAIILDLRMPLINGLGFLYRLRRRREHEHTPVAIVTGAVVDDSTAAEISELGAEVRFKPLWLEDVVQLARDLVAGAA
jgi:CheY-like chemotaxis protein